MRFMIVLPLMLVGCATAPSPQAVAVRDADAKMVEGCEFVAYVSGESAVSGLFQSVGKSNARIYAEEEAAAKGATHIVWDKIESSYWSGGSASGKAYRCATSQS